MKNSFINPINELLNGLKIVLKNAFKPIVTLEYPEKKKNLNENFRGKIKYIKENCVKCGICQKVCPSKGTINISETFLLDYSQCIFCGNCVEHCAKKALVFTKEYELSQYSKDELQIKEDLR